MCVFSCLNEDLKVWRADPGSIFDYDPLEDNIQSKSLRRTSGTESDPVQPTALLDENNTV